MKRTRKSTRSKALNRRKRSIRLKAAVRAKPAASKPEAPKPQGPNPSQSAQWRSNAGLVLVVFCVTGAVLLVAARRPSPPVDKGKVYVEYADHARLIEPLREPDAARSAVPFRTPVVSTRAAGAEAARVEHVPGPAPEPLPVVTVESPATARIVEAAATEPVQHAADRITITGCLERDDDTFRLKDTAGANAPKSRSWKSGFLTKRSAAIELLDPVGAARLPAHVGRRVAAIGTVEGREMHVTSIQRVAGSCD